MKFRTLLRHRVINVLTVIIALTLLAGLLINYGVAFSQDTTATPKAPATDLSQSNIEPTRQPQPEPTDAVEAWNEAMVQIPRPKQGCFTATYPALAWDEILCVAPPDYPMPPHIGPRPLVVGAGNGAIPQAPSGIISTAVGSFDTVTNVTSESGTIGNMGPLVANAYTLQLNTDFFTSTACATSPNSGCRGWEQFVFENFGTGARLFIQYWLLAFNAPCPAGGWTQINLSSSPGNSFCFRNNGAGATPVTPAQPITNLRQLRLTGSVNTVLPPPLNITTDSGILSTGTNMFSVVGENSVNATAGWRAAEFNIFGDGGNSTGASQAIFNAGAEIIPRTQIIYGGTTAPNCLSTGFTAETNNLSFAHPNPAASAPGPALLVRENTVSTAMANCAFATTVGDTHLTTFSGLLYDFQATGDFILAQADPDFVVQTRQISGAPTWPNASVNAAVATQMGKSQVAICAGKERPNLFINGDRVEVDDGKSLLLSDNVTFVRQGNVYFVADETGNSIRAQVNDQYIDVSVGLGTWPTKVTGLLGNANGNVNQLESRDGTILQNPFSFEELYQKYGESWRVPKDESLLSVCGEAKENGVPEKIFTAADLDPQTYEQALAVCAEAEIKDSALRDACILDVSVIGDKTASAVFVDQPSPADVGKFRP